MIVKNYDVHSSRLSQQPTASLSELMLMLYQGDASMKLNELNVNEGPWLSDIIQFC